MYLKKLQNLNIDDKLMVLCITTGLETLEILAEGKTLRQLAQVLKISYNTLNIWRKNHPEIAEILGYPNPKPEPKPEPKPTTPDLSRDPAYRIIYAYDAYGTHFKGYIMEEHTTLQEVWSSIFVTLYFRSFGKSEIEYLGAYLTAMQITGAFKLSNWYLLTYCDVTKKGLIKPREPPV